MKRESDEEQDRRRERPPGLGQRPRLREGPSSVGDLAAAVDTEPSACSPQLRLLRNLGLVAGERHGRSIVYALYDNHVAELLDQALYHVEHLRIGARDLPAELAEPTSAVTTTE
ncbi:ArsR/SmtB family transcription factor [Streptomyces zhihengii]